MSSIKADRRFQWAYGRSPLYCLMDRNTLDMAGWSFFDVLDGDISAPECLHIGCTYGRDQHGSCYYKAFVPRDWTLEEAKRLEELAKRLIDEIVKEEKNGDIS